MTSIKKTVAVVLSVFILCGWLTACGDEVEEVSMYDLNHAMLEAAGNPEDMKYASSADANPQDLLAHVSNIDYGKVKGFFISYAADGSVNADEIVVIQVKKKADLNEAAASLRIHLDTRKTLYATYAKEQMPKLEKARVFTRESLAVLIVCDKPDQVENAFHQFLNK